MGVSLAYCTTASVPQNVKDIIEAEAPHLSPDHGWWTEPLNFFDPGEEDGRLYGETKIYLIGYSTKDGGYMAVDANDDELMAYRDSCFILEKLAEWSKRYGLTWQINCVGEPIGTIVNGHWDRQLCDYVEGSKQLFPWPSSFDEAAKTISAKYASRG